jgi:tRNA G18 (ribose-2'-O)-methylase SpoU
MQAAGCLVNSKMPNEVQLSHKDHHPANITSPLRLLLDNVSDPLNVGSLFRLADAMAIKILYLCGDTCTPPHPKLHKTSRSSEQHVKYHYASSPDDTARQLKHDGITLIGLEITNHSHSLTSHILESLLKKGQDCCLVVGSEKNGVSQEILDITDFCIHIPMLGNNSSMNLVTASAIACFELNQVLLHS